jgi:hypothetical protein
MPESDLLELHTMDFPQPDRPDRLGFFGSVEDVLKVAK